MSETSPVSQKELTKSTNGTSNGHSKEGGLLSRLMHFSRAEKKPTSSPPQPSIGTTQGMPETAKGIFVKNAGEDIVRQGGDYGTDSKGNLYRIEHTPADTVSAEPAKPAETGAKTSEKDLVPTVGGEKFATRAKGESVLSTADYLTHPVTGDLYSRKTGMEVRPQKPAEEPAGMDISTKSETYMDQGRAFEKEIEKVNKLANEALNPLGTAKPAETVEAKPAKPRISLKLNKDDNTFSYADKSVADVTALGGDASAKLDTHIEPDKKPSATEVKPAKKRMVGRVVDGKTIWEEKVDPVVVPVIDAVSTTKTETFQEEGVRLLKEYEKENKDFNEQALAPNLKKKEGESKKETVVTPEVDEAIRKQNIIDVAAITLKDLTDQKVDLPNKKDGDRRLGAAWWKKAIRRFGPVIALIGGSIGVVGIPGNFDANQVNKPDTLSPAPGITGARDETARPPVQLNIDGPYREVSRYAPASETKPKIEVAEDYEIKAGDTLNQIMIDHAKKVLNTDNVSDDLRKALMYIQAAQSNLNNPDMINTGEHLNLLVPSDVEKIARDVASGDSKILKAIGENVKPEEVHQRTLDAANSLLDLK